MCNLNTPVDLLDSAVVVGAALTGVGVMNSSNDVQLNNYPNPFSDYTLIRFDESVLQMGPDLRLQVYDGMGRLMETIVPDEQSAVIMFKGIGYASGIYYYLLLVNGQYVGRSSMVIY